MTSKWGHPAGTADHQYGAVLSPASFEQLELDRQDSVAALQGLASALRNVSAQLSKHGARFNLRDFEYGDGHYEKAIDETMKGVDIALWTEAIAAAGVDSIMTAGDAKAMRDKVEKEAPPFTAEHGRSLVGSLVRSSPKLAMNSIRQVFDRLIAAEFVPGGGGSTGSWRRPKQRQNSRAIQPVFRLSLWWGGMPDYWYRSDDHANALLNDLEMVCLLANDQPRPKYPERLADKMVDGYRDKKQRTFETPYFSIELFKNGNAIIRFSCQQTLDRLNAWGSDGSKLADAPEARA